MAMFQSWFQQERVESNNELLLILFIVLMVVGGFTTLVIWIVKLARQNRFPNPSTLNLDMDESDEEKIRTIRRLEIFKQIMNNQDEDEDSQHNKLAQAVQCLDYYYLSKWTAQLKEAFDTDALDVAVRVQQVMREMDDQMDSYHIGVETKQELFELAQLTDAIQIRDTNRGFSFSTQND